MVTNKAKAVERFIKKPDTKIAAHYILNGYF
jgi:mannose-1-phosphate guanylyltransferase